MMHANLIASALMIIVLLGADPAGAQEPKSLEGYSCSEIAAFPTNPADLTDRQLIYASYAYDHGECGEENDARAYKYYLESAERGDKLSMMRLGHLYANGSGVEKNLRQARYWFRSYALLNASHQKDSWLDGLVELANVDAFHPLFTEQMNRMQTSHTSATMMLQNYHDLMRGNGAIRNIEYAPRWLTLAELQGSTEALYLKARHAIADDGDHAAQKMYLSRAAGRNHPQAQIEYGRLFLGSEGVDPWPYYALVWFVRAQMNGLEVDTDIAEAEKHLIPAERRAAYAKAADFDFKQAP